MAACDGADGVKDGLVSNPPACRFDPMVLACKAADAKGCLTAAEVDTLKALHSGPKDPGSGKQIYAGLVTSGTEAMPMNWPLWVLGGAPGQSAHAGFGISYFRDVVFERPDWQVQSMNFERDVRISNEKVAPILNATSPDLRSFRARGGKLIQYHGWADAAIAAPSSIQYYEAVRSFMSSVPDAEARRAQSRTTTVSSWCRDSRIAVAEWGLCISEMTGITGLRRQRSQTRNVTSSRRWSGG